MSESHICLTDIFWCNKKNAPRFIRLNRPRDRNGWRLLYKINRHPITKERLAKPIHRSSTISGVGVAVAFEDIFAKLLKDIGLAETQPIQPLKVVMKRHFMYEYLRGSTNG